MRIDCARASARLADFTAGIANIAVVLHQPIPGPLISEQVLEREG